VSTADVLPQGSRRNADVLGIVYISIQIYIKNYIVKSEIFTVRSDFRSQILKNTSIFIQTALSLGKCTRYVPIVLCTSVVVKLWTVL